MDSTATTRGHSSARRRNALLPNSMESLQLQCFSDLYKQSQSMNGGNAVPQHENDEIDMREQVRALVEERMKARDNENTEAGPESH